VAHQHDLAAVDVERRRAIHKRAQRVCDILGLLLDGGSRHQAVVDAGVGVTALRQVRWQPAAAGVALAAVPPAATVHEHHQRRRGARLRPPDVERLQRAVAIGQRGSRRCGRRRGNGAGVAARPALRKPVTEPGPASVHADQRERCDQNRQ
jgi:hypothetical protein